MYVGMTRAKHALVLSYVGTNGAEGHSKLLRVSDIPKDYLESSRTLQRHHCEARPESIVISHQS